MNANRGNYAFLPVPNSQSVLRAEKTEICKTLIRPAATDGAESWALNEDVAKRLTAFERKVLRRMFGGIRVNENRRK